MKICEKCNTDYEENGYCENCEVKDGSNLEAVEKEAAVEKETVKEVETEKESVEVKTDNEDDSSSKDLSPKEIKKLAKEEKKKIKEDAKKAKEEAKLAKEEAKKAKIKAKNDKKQAAIDAKQKKQEEKAAAAEKKAEKKRIKAEKKANRKFKKTRRFLWIVFILILVLIGLLAWYLGHSEITDGFTKNDKNTEVIIQSIAKDDEADGKVTVEYEDFNNCLNNNVDFEKLDAISYATIVSGYYSEKESKFALGLKSFLGKTSILVDAKPSVKDGKLKMVCKNPKLGKWQLPIPKGIINTPIEKSFDLPKFGWITIKDIDFEDEGVEIVYDFDLNKINSSFSKLNSVVEPALIKYLENEDIILPGSELIFRENKDQDYQYTNQDVQKILKAFVSSSDDVVNWTLIIPKNMEGDIIDLSKILIGEDKTDQNYKNIQNRKKELLKDFDEFVDEKTEAYLKHLAKDTFKALKAYHKESGLPAYYYGYKGHLYSQTLETYLNLEDLDVDYSKSKNSDKEDEKSDFMLFALGNKAILASQVEKEIWYVKEGEDKINKQEKDKFYEMLLFDDEAKDEFVVRDSYAKSEFEPFAEAIIKEESYGKDDKLEIKFLAYSEENGIAIGFLLNKPEIAPKYYLLSKDNKAWQVIDIFDETERLGEVLIEDFEESRINPKILPSYEMADFERGFLKTGDRKIIEKKIARDYKISFYSMVDKNIYVVAQNKDKDRGYYLFNDGIDGDYIELEEGDEAEYRNELSAKESYKQYRPEFIFNAVDGVFSKKN